MIARRRDHRDLRARVRPAVPRRDHDRPRPGRVTQPVLVTGGTGVVGGAVLRRLVADGRDRARAGSIRGLRGRGRGARGGGGPRRRAGPRVADRGDARLLHRLPRRRRERDVPARSRRHAPHQRRGLVERGPRRRRRRGRARRLHLVLVGDRRATAHGRTGGLAAPRLVPVRLRTLQAPGRTAGVRAREDPGRRRRVREPLVGAGTGAGDRLGAAPARGRERAAPGPGGHDDLADRHRGLREGPRPGRDPRDAGRTVPALGREPDHARGGRPARPDLGAATPGAVRAGLGRDGGRRARRGRREGAPSRRDPVPRGRSDAAPRSPVRRLEGGPGARPALRAGGDDAPRARWSGARNAAWSRPRASAGRARRMSGRTGTARAPNRRPHGSRGSRDGGASGPQHRPRARPGHRGRRARRGPMGGPGRQGGGRSGRRRRDAPDDRLGLDGRRRRDRRGREGRGPDALQRRVRRDRRGPRVRRRRRPDRRDPPDRPGTAERALGDRARRTRLDVLPRRGRLHGEGRDRSRRRRTRSTSPRRPRRTCAWSPRPRASGRKRSAS